MYQVSSKDKTTES